MSDRQGIEIDYCPACRGVWLDRGELDKIIERSASGNAPAHQSYGAPQQHYGYRKRRKSFLEDLFD
jgi:Zn-finger nucleic acid-binding protein